MATPLPVHSSEKCYLCGAQATMIVIYDKGMRGVVCNDCAAKYKLTAFDDSPEPINDQVVQGRLM